MRRQRGLSIEILIKDDIPVVICSADEDWVVDLWLSKVKERAAAEALAKAEPTARAFKGRIPRGRCAYCLQMSDALQREHIVPVSKGGTDDPGNVVSACPSCNRRKKDASLITFVARGGAA